jgi:hypothetical protein
MKLRLALNGKMEDRVGKIEKINVNGYKKASSNKNDG